MKSSIFSKKKINHVAIIMDGNGRWAKKNNVSKKTGHENGIKNCILICENLNKLKYKVNEISFYVFSTENWKRKPSEVRNLFKLIEKYYEELRFKAEKNNLCIRHYGSKKKLSSNLIRIINDVTNKTKENSGIKINLLFNYGSRQEIIDAVSKIRKLNISSSKLAKYFYIPQSADPDLIIRTGGEVRLSNFMLWQSAYAELYFTKIMWPDFKIKNLNIALDNYINRKRKLGK